MKTSIFTLFAFGGFLATSIANPVVAETTVQKRQDYDGIQVQLETLFDQIKEQTAKINETLTPVPDAAPEEEAQVAADAIAPQLEAITELLESSVSIAKRALKARFGPEDIFVTVSIILWELLGTIKFILFKLGLGK
ncbi:hypothetical protein F5B20DRAFT_276423 [Whalleya microplaca]|nr:hypothetical protein F5B20DRAFT_276423 [Whalleya microplaca]